MFEMDAHIGVEHLNLIYMKDDRPHAGFPEKSYFAYAERLVQKGFRVEVVEQVETPEQLAARNELRKKKGQKKDTVVRREKVAVLTRGTIIDDIMLDDCPQTSHLLVLWENSAPNGVTYIGACVVDAATRRVEIGSLCDNESTRLELRALISRTQPVEVVTSTVDGAITEATAKCLNSCLRHDVLRSRSKNCLHDGNGILYLKDQQADEEKQNEWVNLVRHLDSIEGKFDQGSSFEHDQQQQLHCLRSTVLRSLCFTVSYLKSCLIDEQVFSNATVMALHGTWGRCMQNVLPDMETTESMEVDDIGVQYMELDAAAIIGMELLETDDGSNRGSLLSLIDQTATAFGKRLLRRWICAPLSSAKHIVRRQRAIAALRQCGNNMYDLVGFLKKIPDLERALSKLQSIDGGRNAAGVVLYEDSSKQRLGILLGALRGLKKIATRMSEFSSTNNAVLQSSDMLSKLIDSGFWLGTQKTINEFEGIFDWDKAERDGRIIPDTSGVDDAFDYANETIDCVTQELDDYLRNLKATLGTKDVQYVSLNKDTHIINVPDKYTTKVPRKFEKCSKIKGFTRYSSPELRDIVSKLETAKESRIAALECLLKEIIKRFLQEQGLWKECVRRIAHFDVLISLCLASESLKETGPTCTPKFVTNDNDGDSQNFPIFRAIGIRHPCVAHQLSLAGSGSKMFIPNDVNLGKPLGGNTMLLTGPNMGGKSTTLRMVALSSVLAHIGMDAPATEMELSTCDRIFVRMGAQDNILSGQSTFLVELSETASVLQNATKRSLVILDELGRGTSTSDGNAIAYAVLQYLITHIECLALFSTHYHRLVEDVCSPDIQLQHMQLKVEDDATTEEAGGITFLYKLSAGHCPKSFGMNVARLSGVPEDVVSSAERRALIFKEQSELRELRGKLLYDCQRISRCLSTPGHSQSGHCDIREVFASMNQKY